MTQDSTDGRSGTTGGTTAPTVADPDITIDHGELALLRRMRAEREEAATRTATAVPEPHTENPYAAATPDPNELDPADRTVSRAELDALRRVRPSARADSATADGRDDDAAVDADDDATISRAELETLRADVAAERAVGTTAAGDDERADAAQDVPTDDAPSLTHDHSDDDDRTMTREEIAAMRQRAARRAQTRAEARRLFEEERDAEPDRYFRHADTIPYATLRAMRSTTSGEAEHAGSTDALDEIDEITEIPDDTAVSASALPAEPAAHTLSIAVPLPEAELPRDVSDELVEPLDASTAVSAPRNELPVIAFFPHQMGTGGHRIVPAAAPRRPTVPDPAPSAAPAVGADAPRSISPRSGGRMMLIILAVAVIATTLVSVLVMSLLRSSEPTPVPMNTSAGISLPLGEQSHAIGPDARTDA